MSRPSWLLLALSAGSVVCVLALFEALRPRGLSYDGLWAARLGLGAGVLLVFNLVAVLWYASIAREQVAVSHEQSAAYRLSLSIDTALKFDTAFNAPPFKKVRSSAAKALLTHGNEAEADDVFDFFDTEGLLVRLGGVSDEVAHSLLFHWVNLYWKAGKGYIGSKQMETSTVWNDFKSLYERVCDIERDKNQDSEDLTMSESRLRQQLQEEVDDGLLDE